MHVEAVQTLDGNPAHQRRLTQARFQNEAMRIPKGCSDRPGHGYDYRKAQDQERRSEAFRVQSAGNGAHSCAFAAIRMAHIEQSAIDGAAARAHPGWDGHTNCSTRALKPLAPSRTGVRPRLPGRRRVRSRSE